MIRAALFLLLSFVAVSCGPRYVDYFPCHDDGTPKPKVAILPLHDVSKNCLPWDLSSEITRVVYEEVRNDGELFLMPYGDVYAKVVGMGNFDFFNSDDLIAKTFCGQDFIVLIEMIDHSFLSESKNQPDAGLLIKLRVRILDLRSGSPKVILQEIVRRNCRILRSQVDYKKDTPDLSSEEYRNSLIGRTHCQMVSELVKRIENVILSAN